MNKLGLAGIVYKAKMCFFYAVNVARFKKLEFKSYIIKPLRIEGAEYMSIAQGVTVQTSAWLLAVKIDDHAPVLSIGEGSAIGDFNHITAVRHVNIGKHVLTANRVYITDNTHSYEDIHTPVMQQAVKFIKEVSIGDGAWIGENVCILGASVGKNSVIGANSVVTQDIPDHCVAVGSPAKVIKRFNQATNQWEMVK